MIAANYPHLGMNPNQSGDGTRYFAPTRIIPQPAPPPAPAAPASMQNQISPAPVGIERPLMRVATVAIETPVAPPAVPASAAATATPAPVDTSGTFDSFLNWLTEETVFSGFPNGAVLAGGVIAASWFFGGKKGRR